MKQDISDMQKHQAMMMAAGRGTRLRPITDTLPKPLVPVAGQPLMDYSFDLLAAAGLNRAIVNTHYLPHKIEAHLAQKTGFSVSVSREETLLETGGGLKKVLPELEDRFFALNCDIICIDSQPPALARMQQQWDDQMMDGLLLLIPVEKAVGYEGTGDFSLSRHGRLQRPQEGQQAYVFTGIQYLSKRFMHNTPEGVFSLSVLYRRALEQRENSRLFGLVHTGRWYHVGDPAALKEAESQIQPLVT